MVAFQKEPRLKLVRPPLLHLPLSFPPSSSQPLTGWATINLNLPALLPHFLSSSLSRRPETEEEAEVEFQQESLEGVSLPSGKYSHVSFVKVYANCRLRRVWFSDAGPGQELPWEFQLYSGI